MKAARHRYKNSIMIGAVAASSTDIYEAVVALSRSIAGRSDLESLLSGEGNLFAGLSGSTIVGLTLHDRKRQPYAGAISGWTWKCRRKPLLPVDEDPAGWVWLNQQPLVISPARG